MKKILFILVTISLFLLPGCILKKTDNYAPITKDNFTVEKLASGASCVKPSSSLIKRCQNVGGILKVVVTNIGFAEIHAFGCYPEGETKDAGEKCPIKGCEGECIWLAGDDVGSDSHSTCSSYKKTLFKYPEAMVWFLCDSYR